MPFESATDALRPTDAALDAVAAASAAADTPLLSAVATWVLTEMAEDAAELAIVDADNPFESDTLICPLPEITDSAAASATEAWDAASTAVELALDTIATAEVISELATTTTLDADNAFEVAVLILPFTPSATDCDALFAVS